MSAFKDTLKKMVDTLKDAAVDLSSLEVTTMTGDVAHCIDEKGRFDISKLQKTAIGDSETTTTADLRIVAHTRSDFDQDCTMFVKADLTPEERDIFDLHVGMYSAARVSRLAFLMMIAEIVD